MDEEREENKNSFINIALERLKWHIAGSKMFYRSIKKIKSFTPSHLPFRWVFRLFSVDILRLAWHATHPAAKLIPLHLQSPNSQQSGGFCSNPMAKAEFFVCHLDMSAVDSMSFLPLPLSPPSGLKAALTVFSHTHQSHFRSAPASH